MSSYDDIMALNKKIEESPKSMGCFVLFMKSIAVLIILMGIMLCLIKPISGILAIIFGILILLLFRTKNKNLNSNNLIPNVSDDNTHSEFEFTETDKNGKSLLKIYDINVTGVMHNQDGVDPQTIIPQLYEGEQIILEADPENIYDKNAVKVKTVHGQQIGWLPQGDNLQIDIANRLNSGQTVYARVKKGYWLDNYPGKVGIIIDVARYSKR